MKCAIEECENNGKENNDQAKNEGITYHRFPKNPELYDTWMKALHLSKFAAFYRRAICSNHFREDDFCITKQGKRLKNGAVPYLEDCYGPAALRTCKICLTLDAKMYPLKNGLEKMYKEVMGIEPRTDHLNRLPMAICWECTARLQTAFAFKSKALYCDKLLHQHLLNNADIKILHIQRIHKEQTQLQSPMTVQQVFKFNSLDDDDLAPNTFIKAEVIGIPNNEETEVDLQSLVTDKIIIKDERNNSIVVSNLPASEFKTEVDLVPETTSVETDDDTNFDDYYEDGNYETVTENIYVENTDLDLANISTNEQNMLIDIDNVCTNQVKMETDNNVMDISQIMNNKDEELIINLTSDEEKPGDCDDEDIPTPLEDKTVMEKKRKMVEIDDEPLIVWVKGKRPRTQSTYVKPSIPIDENIFSMRPLDPDELRKEILARRDSAQYQNSPFKCEICYKGFPTKEKRENHVLKHTEKYGPIKCNICLVRVKQPRHLRRHVSSQHTTEFICKLCPLKTRTRNVAIEHMKFHNGRKFNCPQCSMEFKMRTSLLNHLRLRHMSGFVCELCGYTFVSAHGVGAHKLKKHKLFDPNTEFTGPYCEECGFKFLTEKAYNRHMRLSSKHITEDDPNRMNNDPSLIERRRARSSKKRVRQPDSGEEEPLTPRKTKRVRKAKKLFQCDHCDKIFTIKQKLVAHMRDHGETQRNHTCDICGKQFTFSYNLTRHKFLHTGLKPFKCDSCKKTFSTSGELRAHVDHVHLKIPRPKRVRRKPNKSEKKKTLD